MKLPTIAQQRKAAKLALSVALGVTAASGFVRGKAARRLHVWAGVATVGLAAWHHLLYSAPGACSRRACPAAKQAENTPSASPSAEPETT